MVVLLFWAHTEQIKLLNQIDSCAFLLLRTKKVEVPGSGFIFTS